MKKDGCYVILTNYNGDMDTIECLESLLRVTSVDLRIIVVDNSPTMKSIQRIQEWGQGKRAATYSDNPILNELVYPYIKKPISLACVNQGEDISQLETKVILTHMPNNRGFAAAMNWGIRLAQREGLYDYYWILNNDTVVDEDAARLMIEKCKTNEKIGICGSKQCLYDNPQEQQKEEFGFNKWICRDKVIPVDSPQKDIMKYSGASFIVTSNFLDKTGLMNEEYFLYCEEHDWVIRGREQGFLVAHEDKAIIYHKGGKSTGEYQSDFGSYLADYYYHRSRILFTLKFYPYCLPTLYLAYLGSILKRLRWRKYDRIVMLIRLMINPKRDLLAYMRK